MIFVLLVFFFKFIYLFLLLIYSNVEIIKLVGCPFAYVSFHIFLSIDATTESDYSMRFKLKSHNIYTIKSPEMNMAFWHCLQSFGQFTQTPKPMFHSNVSIFCFVFCFRLKWRPELRICTALMHALASLSLSSIYWADFVVGAAFNWSTALSYNPATVFGKFEMPLNVLITPWL